MNAEDAFAPTEDRSHFFASSAADVVLAQLQQGLDHGLPITVVTGESGLGKSAVAREACARWGSRVRGEWLVAPVADPDALLTQVVQLFGGLARGDDSRTGWLAALSRALGILAEQDKTPVLIVDNAHLLSVKACVALAAVHAAATEAKRSLRIILLGLPGLETLLDNLKVDALVQLVGVRCRMSPLPPQDVRHYLHHRVAAAGGDGERVFSRKSARELHAASGGVPGVLDQLAAESIRSARAAGTPTVAQEHVRAAVTSMRRPAAAKHSAETNEPDDTDEAIAQDEAPPAASKAASTKPAAPAKGAAKAASPEPTAAKPPAEKKPVRRSLFDPMPFPEPPALDSRHPRVKEWVSRFTEEDTPTRFGARLQLPPLTDPESLPVFEEPAPPPPPKSVRKPAREPEPEPIAFTPELSEPEPIVIVPEPIVLAPEPIVLKSDAVTPLEAPIAPVATKPAPQQSQDTPRGNRKQRRQLQRERAAAATPPPAPARAAAVVPVRAVSPAPPAPRRVLVDESVTQAAPAIAVAENPPPMRMNISARPPGQGRFMHVVVPGVLMLGVAAAAIVAGTRGGFERDQPHVPSEAIYSTPVEPTPDPNIMGPAAPVTPTQSAVSTPVADLTSARFCLAVGTYLFSDRANSMSRKLARRTKLESWVETVESDGARNYRVMLGGFATEADAEQVADRLLTRGVVSEALVQPVPAGHTPQ